MMEYCERGRLSDWLKSIDEISGTVQDQMNDLCRQVALGMYHLHQNQVKC